MESTPGAPERLTRSKAEQFLTPEEIKIILESTKAGREFPDRRTGGVIGDFAQELLFEQVANGYYQTFLYPERPKNIGLIGELRLYADKLLKLGVPQVNIVDFGAGGTGTLLDLSQKASSQIDSGKLRLIATNLRSSGPTEEALEYLEREAIKEFGFKVVDQEQIDKLRQNLKSNRVEFLKADILELFDFLQGEYVHLMFMMTTPSITSGENDHILKVASEMLDPKFGTITIDSGGTYHHRARRKLPNGSVMTDFQIFQKGLKHFESKGFSQRSTGHLAKYLVLQAPNSPPLVFNDEPSKLAELSKLDRRPGLMQQLFGKIRKS